MKYYVLGCDHGRGGIPRCHSLSFPCSYRTRAAVIGRRSSVSSRVWEALSLMSVRLPEREEPATWAFLLSATRPMQVQLCCKGHLYRY
jgi:hypothetical protein